MFYDAFKNEQEIDTATLYMAFDPEYATKHLAFTAADLVGRRRTYCEYAQYIVPPKLYIRELSHYPI